jgi:hypothetical protein
MLNIKILKNATCLMGAMGAMLLTAAFAQAASEMPSREKMWQMILKQQKQIEALTAKQSKTESQLAQADEKIEATSVFAEQMQQDNASANLGWWNKTQIGGYGELHYNGLKDSGDDQVDLHRFVLFASHDFNDNIRFFSELEIEHSVAGEGQSGAVEIEQAYVEFDLSDTQQAKAGVFLLPVGIINETHEPAAFFGVERNPVEKNIIPATWWEAGAALNGEIGQGFSYDVAVHSGLNTPTTGGDAFKIRNGRQKVAKAQADKGAVTGRIKWTGMPGVELASSLQYQQDITQGDFSETVSATLFETHADIRKGPWGLRALYARWDLQGTAPKNIGRDEQMGWYVEPSYRWDTSVGKFGVFARYNTYDNSAGSGSGTDTEFVQYDIGINYWPHSDVVLKADMQFNKDPGAGADDEILNLGIGYQF